MTETVIVIKLYRKVSYSEEKNRTDSFEFLNLL